MALGYTSAPMSQASASSFVGSIPEFYDRHLGPVIFEPYARDLAARLPQRAGLCVLETACGTGIVTRSLLEQLPADGRLIATDLNEPMVAHARARMPADPRLELRQADAQALPFEDCSLGAVVCQFGVMFFPDKPLAMREAKRVLEPGGVLMFNVWDGFEANAFGRVAHETIAGFFAAEPPAIYRTALGWNDARAIRDTVEGAGFRDVRLEVVGRDVVSESAAHFATGLVKGNPVMPPDGRSTVSADAIVDAIASRLATAWGSSPCRGPTRAIVVSARA